MRQSFGSLVARFLTGSWRHSPPPFQCSIEELNRIAPMLIRSGEGALAWRKIRDTELSTTPIARELEQVYRLSTLSAGVDEHLISEVVSRFNEIPARGLRDSAYSWMVLGDRGRLLVGLGVVGSKLRRDLRPGCRRCSRYR